LEKVKPYQQIVDLLCTVPGIKNTAAIGIIAEIGVDMSAFYSDKHLCSWAGVSPQNYQSAGKRKNVPAKSGNGYLTSMLVQCANAAVKEANSSLTNRFESIQARRVFLASIKCSVPEVQKCNTPVYIFSN
jgi:transposase